MKRGRRDGRIPARIGDTGCMGIGYWSEQKKVDGEWVDVWYRIYDGRWIDMTGSQIYW